MIRILTVFLKLFWVLMCYSLFDVKDQAGFKSPRINSICITNWGLLKILSPLDGY